MVSNENAETKFGADQGETNMIKLVDGKLTPIGDTDDDVVDGQLSNRYSSDEERSLQGDPQRGKTYENSDASLYVGEGVDEHILPNDPIAVADITGNPDAGSTTATGLPSEDDQPDSPTGSSTATNTFVGWPVIGGNTAGSLAPHAMIPPTPGTPTPSQPNPVVPETPPSPPTPGPEIPDLPSPTNPPVPDIQNRSSSALYTFTAVAVAPTRYEDLAEGAQADPGSAEGMETGPDTGESARPYDVNAKDTHTNQPGERPEEGKETQHFPREMADESSIAAQDMLSGPDRSDQKSTEGLDKKYNDLDASRDMAS